MVLLAVVSYSRGQVFSEFIGFVFLIIKYYFLAQLCFILSSEVNGSLVQNNHPSNNQQSHPFISQKAPIPTDLSSFSYQPKAKTTNIQRILLSYIFDSADSPSQTTVLVILLIIQTVIITDAIISIISVIVQFWKSPPKQPISFKHTSFIRTVTATCPLVFHEHILRIPATLFSVMTLIQQNQENLVFAILNLSFSLVLGTMTSFQRSFNNHQMFQYPSLQYRQSGISLLFWILEISAILISTLIQESRLLNVSLLFVISGLYLWLQLSYLPSMNYQLMRISCGIVVIYSAIHFIRMINQVIINLNFFNKIENNKSLIKFQEQSDLIAIIVVSPLAYCIGIIVHKIRITRICKQIHYQEDRLENARQSPEYLLIFCQYITHLSHRRNPYLNSAEEISLLVDIISNDTSQFPNDHADLFSDNRKYMDWNQILLSNNQSRDELQNRSNHRQDYSIDSQQPMVTLFLDSERTVQIVENYLINFLASVLQLPTNNNPYKYCMNSSKNQIDQSFTFHSSRYDEDAPSSFATTPVQQKALSLSSSAQSVIILYLTYLHRSPFKLALEAKQIFMRIKQNSCSRNKSPFDKLEFRKHSTLSEIFSQSGSLRDSRKNVTRFDRFLLECQINSILVTSFNLYNYSICKPTNSGQEFISKEIVERISQAEASLHEADALTWTCLGSKCNLLALLGSAKSMSTQTQSSSQASSTIQFEELNECLSQLNSQTEKLKMILLSIRSSAFELPRDLSNCDSHLQLLLSIFSRNLSFGIFDSKTSSKRAQFNFLSMKSKHKSFRFPFIQKQPQQQPQIFSKVIHACSAYAYVSIQPDQIGRIIFATKNLGNIISGQQNAFLEISFFDSLLPRRVARQFIRTNVLPLLDHTQSSLSNKRRQNPLTFKLITPNEDGWGRPLKMKIEPHVRMMTGTDFEVGVVCELTRLDVEVPSRRMCVSVEVRDLWVTEGGSTAIPTMEVLSISQELFTFLGLLEGRHTQSNSCSFINNYFQNNNYNNIGSSVYSQSNYNSDCLANEYSIKILDYIPNLVDILEELNNQSSISDLQRVVIDNVRIVPLQGGNDDDDSNMPTMEFIGTLLVQQIPCGQNMRIANIFFESYPKQLGSPLMQHQSLQHLRLFRTPPKRDRGSEFNEETIQSRKENKDRSTFRMKTKLISSVGGGHSKKYLMNKKNQEGFPQHPIQHNRSHIHLNIKQKQLEQQQQQQYPVDNGELKRSLFRLSNENSKKNNNQNSTRTNVKKSSEKIYSQSGTIVSHQSILNENISPVSYFPATVMTMTSKTISTVNSASKKDQIQYQQQQQQLPQEQGLSSGAQEEDICSFINNSLFPTPTPLSIQSSTISLGGNLLLNSSKQYSNNERRTTSRLDLEIQGFDQDAEPSQEANQNPSQSHNEHFGEGLEGKQVGVKESQENQNIQNNHKQLYFQEKQVKSFLDSRDSVSTMNVIFYLGSLGLLAIGVISGINSIQNRYRVIQNKENFELVDWLIDTSRMLSLSSTNLASLQLTLLADLDISHARLAAYSEKVIADLHTISMTFSQHILRVISNPITHDTILVQQLILHSTPAAQQSQELESKALLTKSFIGSSLVPDLLAQLAYLRVFINENSAPIHSNSDSSRSSSNSENETEGIIHNISQRVESIAYFHSVIEVNFSRINDSIYSLSLSIQDELDDCEREQLEQSFQRLYVFAALSSFFALCLVPAFKLVLLKQYKLLQIFMQLDRDNFTTMLASMQFAVEQLKEFHVRARTSTSSGHLEAEHRTATKTNVKKYKKSQFGQARLNASGMNSRILYEEVEAKLKSITLLKRRPSLKKPRMEYLKVTSLITLLLLLLQTAPCIDYMLSQTFNESADAINQATRRVMNMQSIMAEIQQGIYNYLLAKTNPRRSIFSDDYYKEFLSSRKSWGETDLQLFESLPALKHQLIQLDDRMDSFFFNVIEHSICEGLANQQNRSISSPSSDAGKDYSKGTYESMIDIEACKSIVARSGDLSNDDRGFLIRMKKKYLDFQRLIETIQLPRLRARMIARLDSVDLVGIQDMRMFEEGVFSLLLRYLKDVHRKLHRDHLIWERAIMAWNWVSIIVVWYGIYCFTRSCTAQLQRVKSYLRHIDSSIFFEERKFLMIASKSHA